MPMCAMKFCKYSSNKNYGESEITFHKFPTDFFWKEKWIDLVRKCRTENDWVPSETSVICSSHFADIDWYITRRSKNQRKPEMDNTIEAEGIPSTSDDNSLILPSAKPDRPPGPRYAERPCLVCNDDTVNDNRSRRGYYYGAFTCKSCMNFFRRCENGDHKLNFVCKKNEFCDLSQYISYRELCQFCRYKKCLAVGMVPYFKEEAKEMLSSPFTQELELEEPAAMDPVKSEPITSDDACTGAIANGNIFNNEEAENVTLPAADPLVTHLKYEQERASDDFIAVKNEVSYLNQMDTSTGLVQDDETISLQNKECSSEDILLSTLRFEYGNPSEQYKLSMKRLPGLCDIAVNNPIVYTTRLDDMKALNNVHCNFDKENLYETIIIESKPTFKSYNDNRSRTDYESEISFKNLVENLNTINMTWRVGLKPKDKAHDHIKALNLSEIDISVSLSKRSKNLLKMCKPLSIPLEDLKNKDSKKNKHLKSVSKAKRKSKVERPISNESLQTTISSWRRIQPETTIFIILNYRNTNVIEMYSMDGYGNVRQYYRNNVCKSDMYQYSVQTKIFYKLKTNVCCWYKRERELKSIFIKLDMIIPLFMKALHHCEGTHCTCCCKPYDSIDSRDSTYIFIIDDPPELQTKNIIQSLYTLHNKGGSLLINTAVRYKPRTQIKKSSKQAVLTKLQNNTVIRLKNNRTHEYEYYELGANGEVVKYIKYHERDEKTYSLTILKPLTYCCWFERENVLRKLPSMNVSPNALIFMKTPHGCPLNDCHCCCKFIRYKDQNRRPTSKINIPNSLTHTSNNNKSTFVTIEFSKKSPVLNIIPKPVSKTKSLHIVDLTGIDSSDPQTISYNTTKHDQQSNINSKSNIDRKKEVISLKSNITDKILIFNSLESNKVDRKLNVDFLDPNRTASPINLPEMRLKRLTEVIFEKFSNVTLEINNEGKVVAKINTSEKELSNADLKTLGYTITLAQKEIDQLKLAPGIIFNKPNIATHDTTTVPTNIEKLRPILYDLNKDVNKGLSTIIPDNIGLKTINMSKKTSCHLSAVDNLYGNFSSLYYANRIHSQTAFLQLKKDNMIFAKTLLKKPLNKTLVNIAPKNKLSILNSTYELGSGNEIAGKMTPQILNNTQSSDTIKFRVQSTLGKTEPVHGAFSNFLFSSKNKEGERVEVFTHKSIKRNHNMADQNETKRPRVETIQSNEMNNVNNQQISNNAATYQLIIDKQEPFSAACNNVNINPNNPFLPSTAEVCNQYSNMATQVDFPKIKKESGNRSGIQKITVSSFAHIGNKNVIDVIPAAPKPVLIPHVNSVSENIMFGPGVAQKLQPLTLVSPQTPIVKVDPPTLARLSLPAYPLGGNNNVFGVIPAVPSPVQIPHVNLVSENIMFDPGVAQNLQPLILVSPQTPIVKVEPPTLARLPLPVYPIGGETDVKQEDDCILGI